MLLTDNLRALLVITQARKEKDCTDYDDLIRTLAAEVERLSATNREAVTLLAEMLDQTDGEGVVQLGTEQEQRMATLIANNP